MIAAVVAVALATATGWLLTGPCWARQRVGWLNSDRSAAPRASLSGRFAEPVTHLGRRLRGYRADRAARRAVLELCTALAAELRSGRSPVEALRLAVGALSAQDRAGLAGLAETATHGGDVPKAMRRLAPRPGCAAMAWLAACWQVGVESGAGLAEAVERLAGTLRDEERCRREVAAQLAAPRATARLLAFLPLFGILLGTGLGQHPVAFLLGTPYGLACLAAGIGLNVLGLAWTSRLARSAEKP